MQGGELSHVKSGGGRGGRHSGCGGHKTNQIAAVIKVMQVVKFYKMNMAKKAKIDTVEAKDNTETLVSSLGSSNAALKEN